jgi:hypothetical protein
VDTPIYLDSSGIPELTKLNEQKKRSVGIHWSSLVNDLLYPNSSDPDEATRLRWALGRLMERALFESLEEEYPGRYVQLPEITYEGIKFNTDRYDMETERVVESKFTWRSSFNHSIPIQSKCPPDHDLYSKKYWGNWLQAGGYVICLNGVKIPCKGALLWLIHPQGDYRKFEPTSNVWRRDFSQKDLDTIWNIGIEQRKKFCETCGEKKDNCKNEVHKDES